MQKEFLLPQNTFLTPGKLFPALSEEVGFLLSSPIPFEVQGLQV